MKIFLQSVGAILSIVAIFYVGRYVGRKNCEERVVKEIVYIKSDPQTIEIEKPVPYKVEVIKKVPEPYAVIDTVRFVELIDTAKIIAEFLTRKYYDQVLLNDTTGYIRLQQTVAMNIIEDQKLTYVPPPIQVVYRGLDDNPRLRWTVGGEFMFKNDRQDLVVKGGVYFRSHYLVTVGYSMSNMKVIGFNYIF